MPVSNQTVSKIGAETIKAREAAQKPAQPKTTAKTHAPEPKSSQPDGRPTENLITRIFTATDSMSEGERRITDYLLHHQSAAMGMSQAELARVCEVSAPTVSRFCKHVGEKDYHSFQLALMQASTTMHDGNRSTNAPLNISADDVEGSLRNLLAAKITDITSTIESLPAKDVAEVVSLLANAHMVEFAATGRTLSTAMDAAYKFERLGILSTTSMYYEKLLSTAILLSPKDVFFVISRSGWSGVLQQVAHAAKDQGATMVLITGNRNCPLSQMADYVFLATSTDGLLDNRTGNSRISEAVIIEALYALTASFKKDSNEYLERHGNYVFSAVDLP